MSSIFDQVMKWLTIKEAVKTSGLSEKTIRRRIKANNGTNKIRKEGRKWLIRSTALPGHEPGQMTRTMTRTDDQVKNDYIATLKAELKEKNEQIHRLMDQMEQNQDMQRTMALLLNGYRRQLGISIDQVVEDVEEVPPLDKSQARSFGDWISATKN